MLNAVQKQEEQVQSIKLSCRMRRDENSIKPKTNKIISIKELWKYSYESIDFLILIVFVPSFQLPEWLDFKVLDFHFKAEIHLKINAE